jgi:hypothetical protein
MSSKVGIKGLLHNNRKSLTYDSAIHAPVKYQNWMHATPIAKTTTEAKKGNKIIHYSEEQLKQLSDNEFDRIYKELETEYNKFTRKIQDERTNIKQDETELENMLKIPNDESTLNKIEQIKIFIKDSKQLILQFTELKRHIENSLHLFDEFNKRRNILKRIVGRQIIRPISTRHSSSAELKQIESQIVPRRPNSVKSHNRTRHYGGKRARTRKHRKSRSRK